MIEKKVVSVMNVLWWVFLGMIIVSTRIIPGALGWWVFWASVVLALGTSTVKLILFGRIDKKNAEHLQELENVLRSPKL